MASDWEEVVLGDYVDHQKGYIFKSKDYQDEGELIVRVSDFTDRSIDISSCNRIDKLRVHEFESVKLNAHDVIIATVGSWPKNPASIVGKTVSVPKEAEGALLNQNAVRLRAINGVEQRFLFSLLKNKAFQSYIVSTAQGSANQASITLRDIFRYSFELPPLPEQKAIAHILGSLDDKIELNRQMNETLEAMAQALFKSWFVDFDPVIDNALAAGNAIPDEFIERAEQRKATERKDNSDIQSLFPDEFEFTEEMGWIPRGWSVDSIENLIEINPKITLKKGTVAPHADMKALPESGYSIDGVIEKAYSGGTKFENRDVLFARITPCLENGKTGLVDFLKPKEVGFGSTEFIVLREKDDIKMEFVACLARNSKFRLHAQQSMVGSSGRQRVQNACFSSFYLALPKDDGRLLKLFNETTAVNFDKTSILTNECQTLAKLRDTLLSKLMSGELRIPDAAALVDEAI